MLDAGYWMLDGKTCILLSYITQKNHLTDEVLEKWDWQAFIQYPVSSIQYRFANCC
jgi:hypothetical protein